MPTQSESPNAEEVEAEGRVLITRRGLEVLGALLVTGFGALIVWGATEFEVGWSERGPGTGYFPFWTGIVVMIGGLGTLLDAIRRRDLRNAPAITSSQARRALVFLAPLVGFLLVSSVLGLYIGMVAYLVTVMTWQGGYRLLPSLAVSVGTAAFFFVVFEKVLKVALLKGPLEAWLGVH